MRAPSYNKDSEYRHQRANYPTEVTPRTNTAVRQDTVHPDRKICKSVLGRFLVDTD